MNKSKKIAHISDLHLTKLSLSPLQFFSKRWLGNLNYVFKRRNMFLPSRMWDLIEVFKKEHVEDILISGDVSTTASFKEFSLAKSFVQALEHEGFHVYSIPGNHDHYTMRSYKQGHFYRYFREKLAQDSRFSLQKDGSSSTRIGDNLYLIALDTACATSLYYSSGLFSPKVEASLKEELKGIPPKAQIILMNHFPFFQHEHPRRQLERAPVLKEIIKQHPNIFMYLHGHCHRHTFVDLRKSGLPIVLDSGSTTLNKGATFNMLSLYEDRIDIDKWAFNEAWQKEKGWSVTR